MTTRKPLVLVNGGISELSQSDDLGLMPVGTGGIGLTEYTGTPQLLTTGDLNDPMATGIYRFAGTVTNTPFDGAYAGHLIHTNRSPVSRAQWAISDNGVLAYRVMSTTWGNWQYPVRGSYNKVITDFGATVGATADAAALRSLLSVSLSTYTVQGTNATRSLIETSSADTIAASGAYSLGPSALSNPYSGTWCQLQHLEHVEANNYGMQLASPVSSVSLLKMRKKNANSFSPWKHVWTEDSLPSEIGTWTPQICDATGAGSATYSVQFGKYTRIGNRVYFTLRVIWTGFSGATGVLRVTLPMVTINVNACACYTETLTLPFQHVVGVTVPSTSHLLLRCSQSSSAFGDVQLQASGAITLSGHYDI